jgi:hypothetical protein
VGPGVVAAGFAIGQPRRVGRQFGDAARQRAHRQQQRARLRTARLLRAF